MLEAALLFLVFFGPLAFGCVETWSLAILQAVLFSLPLLARRSRSRPTGEAPRALSVGIGVLLAVGGAQALYPASLEGPLPWLPFTASAGETGKALILWASYGALVWAAPAGFSGRDASRRFAWAVVLIGFGIAVIGLIQKAQGNTLVMGFRPVGYGRSPFGPYYNNGHAASVLALCSLMGAGLLGAQLARILGRGDGDRSRADEVARLSLLTFMIAVILFGLFSTSNRGSVLALGGASLIVGLMACGWLKKPALRWGARAAVVIVFLAAGAAVRSSGLLSRGAQTSVPMRLSMYRSGFKLLADAPVWGTGLGTVIKVFAPYKEPVVVGIVDHVHNDWLELPLQAGIPASAVVLAALTAFGWRVRSRWRTEASPERRCLIGGGIAAALCFLLHAMVEFTWQIPANAVIFLLILSWLWSQTGFLTAGRRVAPRAEP